MLINGHNLYVENYGPIDGMIVVLLHHGLGSTKAWGSQIKSLEEAGCRIIVYDRWGYGSSDMRPSLSIPTFVDDIQDLKEILDRDDGNRVVLIGHSDGGTLALYFAARYPEYVTGLITIAAHIYVEDKMIPGIERIRESFEFDARFRTGLSHLHGDMTEKVFNNWYNGWHNADVLDWDMRKLLPKIQCPTLVVQGLLDEHATSQHARDIADCIDGAELWLVPGAGHMVPQEVPELYNRRMVEFIREV
jgi:pimeloyl-ACP methyl ester carboxylesterase